MNFFIGDIFLENFIGFDIGEFLFLDMGFFELNMEVMGFIGFIWFNF